MNDFRINNEYFGNEMTQFHAQEKSSSISGNAFFLFRRFVNW